MSHGNKLWYYCMEHKWDMDCLGSFTTPFMTGYIECAEMIAKELDDQDGEPQERRQFWLKQDDHDTPMLMDVFTELKVEYYASMGNTRNV